MRPTLLLSPRSLRRRRRRHGCTQVGCTTIADSVLSLGLEILPGARTLRALLVSLVVMERVQVSRHEHITISHRHTINFAYCSSFSALDRYRHLVHRPACILERKRRPQPSTLEQIVTSPAVAIGIRVRAEAGVLSTQAALI